MSENNTSIFTLTFDLAGGTGSFDSVTGEAGSYYKLPSTYPQKIGYGFMGWKNTANETFQTGGDYWFNYANDTLTAVWGYTVTLDANGGECEAVVKGGIDEVLDLVPTKDGYTFIGWRRGNGDLCTPYTFSYGDDALVAVWGYTVSFDLAGGEGDISEQTKFLDEIITVPEAPVRANYCFEYWEAPDGAIYTPGDTYAAVSNTTLTARWSCGVYFDFNGGEGECSMSAANEGNCCIIPTATREGYTFVKWVGVNGNEYTSNDTYYFIYGDDTLTAVWECTVCFETNGAEESLDSITKSPDESVTLPSVVKEGYNLVGWINSEGIGFAPNGTYPFVYGNDTLCAVWEVKTYTVTYDVEGFADQTKEYFTNVTLHTSVPIREGHTFLNWEGNNGSYYDSGEEYTVNENLSLSAVWVENGKTVITYDLNGGTGEFLKQTKGESESITLHSGKPTAEGMGFYCWVDQNGNTYEAGVVYSGSESLKLTADMRITYTYTYLNEDGSVLATQTKLDGVPLEILLQEPSLDGDYEFIYWSIMETGGITVPGREASIDMDITLIPEKRIRYEIAYWATTEICDLVNKYHNKDIIVEDVTSICTADEYEALLNQNMKFVCWQWCDRNEYYYPGDVLKKNETGRLEAIWVENDKVAVTFDVGDAEGEYDSIAVTPGTEIIIPNAAPVKEGYIFEGWTNGELNDDVTETASYSATRTVTSYDGEYKIFPLGLAVMIYINTKFFPVWKKAYTISYKTNGANENFENQTKLENITLSIHSTVPTKSGYTFAGWKGENTNIRISAGGTFDLNCAETLVAQWEGQSLLREIKVIPQHKTLDLQEEYFYADVEFVPEDSSDKTVYWSSNNPTVATVDRNTGKIIPKKQGEATITVFSNTNNIKAQFKIKVDNREKVIVERDETGAYSRIVFNNGKVWNCINKDRIYDAVPNVNSPESLRFFDNVFENISFSDNQPFFSLAKEYDESEIKLIYSIDPHGLAAYVQEYAAYMYNNTNHTIAYKDEIFELLFGRAPKCYKRNLNGTWYETNDRSDAQKIMSESECLFGGHPIYDAKTFLELLSLAAEVISTAFSIINAKFILKEPISKAIKVIQTFLSLSMSVKDYVFLENDFSSFVTDVANGFIDEDNLYKDSLYNDNILDEGVYKDFTVPSKYKSQNYTLGWVFSLMSFSSNLETIANTFKNGPHFYKEVFNFCDDLDYNIIIEMSDGKHIYLSDINAVI